MYSLRYQRYRLFNFLLNEIDLNLDFHAKDQQGNTILHYAILYAGNDTQIMDRLIEKYKKFAINIDERNSQGFTPLLLGKMITQLMIYAFLETNPAKTKFSDSDPSFLKLLFGIFCV
jgi:ankyrin repeat protein